MAPDHVPSGLESLIKALAWFDDKSRIERAQRIAWASSLYEQRGVVAGALVPLQLMEEARVSYVNGQYMAVVLAATAVIEHLLTEELEVQSSVRKSWTFGATIQRARTSTQLPASVLDDADRLRLLRNHLAHRSAESSVGSLSERYREQKVHPETLLDGDARLALNTMYEVFRDLLRPAR